jgi:hypothetical protein
MKVRDTLCGLLVGCLPLSSAWAQDKKEVPAGTPVTIIVKPAEPTGPPIIIKPNGRQAKGEPVRCGCGKTGGGNIDVAQPTPDVLILTVTASALADGFPCVKSSAAFNFDVTQCFSVSFEKTDLKYPKMTVEGRVIGLLRTPCKGGCASEHATVAIAPACGGPALTLQMPSNQACDGQNLSVNDHEGPCGGPLVPGKYVLKANLSVSADRAPGLCKPSTAEFAPDPSLDPLWLDPKEPFHGAAKKDFGFQIILKVLEEPPPGNGNGEEKKVEELPKPEPEKKPEGGVEKIPQPKP